MKRGAEEDHLYARAVAVVIRARRTSTTGLQRHLCVGDGEVIGYNRCAWLLARMEYDGIVGRIDSENRRDVLLWLQ
jgi:S-DNA-T family DNA segregation ATPase FtsK/SpoIIIE